MDIRSYFQPKKTPKPIIEDDDDDVIPGSPEVQTKIKKKKSNDESKVTQKNKSKSKPVLKEVKTAELFGSGPIKRTEPLVKKDKKNTETGIHSDDDFEKSLLEIDDLELNTNKKIDNTATNPINEIHSPPNIKQEKISPRKSSSKTDKNIKDVTPRKSHTKEVKKSPIKGHKSKYFNSHSSKSDETSSNKRKFSEFIENDANTKDSENKKTKVDSNENKHCDGIKIKKEEHYESLMDNSVLQDQEDTPKNKKKKLNTSLNDSVLTDEERHERKMQSVALYQKYLNRSGPKHLGAKKIPEGAPNCLKDCNFLLTGVLDSFEREEIVAAINKYGGCIKNGISKKVTHVLAGDDAGPAKMAKAQELGITILGEDEFLKMIESSMYKSDKQTKEIKKDKDENRKSSKDKIKREKLKSNGFVDDDKKISKRNSNHDEKPKDVKLKLSPTDKSKTTVTSSSSLKDDIKIEKAISEPIITKETIQENGTATSDDLSVTMAWVEKHKPKTLKNIIGQSGENSNVSKLSNWLTKWYVNRKAKLPKPSPWAKNDDGGYFKAALLSGPPGVGKTTTVSLVCQSLGFDMVEFNASDTRNKTLIKEQIGELLTTKSLSGYAKGDTSKQAVSKKHVLVMDEVDGMAGNEDRGGLQELIALIKSASVPIICMCNDRNSQKMRSLVNYCYDLRFNRPRVAQIRSAMLTVCFKENIKIPSDILDQLIVSANQDVRQTLNLLSMWAVDPTRADAERLRKDANTVKKDIKLGPWEAVRKVFTAAEHKNMSINDRSDLFFYDYSLAPLFVQENYLQVAPHCSKNEVLDRISQAADSIAAGDLIEARIRGSQAWNLLPTQAMYSSVIPGHAMAGHVTGQINFPAWLGKNSRANKMHRMCQEIHAHTRLSTSGSKSSIFLDYAAHLRDAIVNPLIKDRSDGISKSLEVLESYHLLREDLDSLTELSLWPGQRNPTILIDSKVKAAMTRTYNKSASALPYAPGAIKRGRARADDDEMADDDAEENDNENENDSDPENDALIKKKKSAEKSNTSKEKPSTSKSKPASKEKKKK